MSTGSKMALGPQPLLPETWSEPKQKGYSSSWTLKKRAESPDTKYQGADSVTVTSMLGTTLILEFLQSLFFMSKNYCSHSSPKGISKKGAPIFQIQAFLC